MNRSNWKQNHPGGCIACGCTICCCDSLVEEPPEPELTLGSAVDELLSQCVKVERFAEMPDQLRVSFVEAIENVTQFIPEEDDPKEMGWVGDNGLP